MAMTSGPNGISRALRLLAAVSALALVAAAPTAAHAKSKKLKMDPSVPTAPEPTGPVPPEADANGHVNYGNPQADGIGRVTVKSKSGDKVQVYLEGRYFGDAPITIYSVPKGDYIVEGTIVSSGKQVSSPVSVSENEEATVELGGGKIETPVAATEGSGGGAFSGQISPNRLLATKIFIGVAAVGLVGGVVFGILEKGAESDYEKSSPASSDLQNIRNRGNTDALLCDVGFGLLGVGIIGAVISGYPMVVKGNAEKAPDAAPPAPTAFLAPIVGHGTTGGALSFRF
ncbi:MAG TPA: hypothetical protein VH560_02985 [Polyangia bacterium]|jgi:hypothetical protein|nr:hypothetical protein [Polyangia bacterium]